MHREHLFTAARVVFALFYFSTGVAIAAFLLFGLGRPPSQPNVAAQAFTDALSQAHFLDPLLALSYLVGGGALLFRRTAPLGLTVLAPVVLVIFTFHLVLSGQWMWGTLNLVWLLALAWHFRSAFRPLWTYALPTSARAA